MDAGTQADHLGRTDHTGGMWRSVAWEAEVALDRIGAKPAARQFGVG